MSYRDIELSGGTIRVHSVPPKIHQVVEKKFPSPDPPIVETVTATGATIKTQILDDPVYLDAMTRIEAEREDLFSEMYMLMALRQVKMPKDFDVGILAETLQYADPDWKPREGPAGKKLDYIEWELLADTEDYRLVTNVIAELSGVDTEEVKAVEASFPGDVEGPASPPLQDEGTCESSADEHEGRDL